MNKIINRVSYKKNAKNDYTGYRPWTDADSDPSKRGAYQWISYQDFGDYAINYGAGLRVLGVDENANIGIFRINRPEWYVAHMGNLSQTFRSTALYDTLGPDAVAYIVKHSECPVWSLLPIYIGYTYYIIAIIEL